MVKKILLTQGRCAIVDDHWFEYLSQWNWQAARIRAGLWYAVRGEWDGKRTRVVYMHRVIARASKGLRVRHLDGDGLNNLESNLVVATRSLTSTTRKPRSDNTSKYKGIYIKRGRVTKKWMARITVNGKQKYLGTFDSPRAAAQAYDDAARKHFGQFAHLNFPEGH